MSEQLKWPERPTCHDSDWQAQRFGIQTWRNPSRERSNDHRFDPDPYRETYRSCSYCGAMHPEDLFNALRSGARLERTTKLYKFYIEGIPNPKAGEPLPNYTYCGSLSTDMAGSGEWEKIQDGYNESTGEPKFLYRKLCSMSICPSTTPAKWYTEHLLDLNEEAFRAITDLIARQTGRRYIIADGRLMVKLEPPSSEA